MMRRIAVVGDRLDSGGEINPYEGPPFLIHGHQAALIGGSAYCPVCKTSGYIVKNGGPRRMNFFTSELALHDDEVICACPISPRIFAELATEAWYDDLAESLGTISPRTTSIPLASTMYNDHFALFDIEGRMLANTAYAVQRANGTFEYGVTNDRGHTHLLASVAAAENINMYLAG